VPHWLRFKAGRNGFILELNSESFASDYGINQHDWYFSCLSTDNVITDRKFQYQVIST